MNERAVAAWVVKQAALDFRSLKGGADAGLREEAEIAGYAGATDEMISFFHSAQFGNLVDQMDGIDRDRLERRLGIPDRYGCLCASCTKTDGMRIPDQARDLPMHTLIMRIASEWLKKLTK